jgi:hypothetical protein
MVENLKKINNPLTIIAIFAALAEINATIALSFIAPTLQPVFIWFVIGFPTLLVLLFFITWNFNPKVMYAPTDFKHEENFLTTLRGVTLNKSLNVNKNNIEAIQQEFKLQDTSSIGSDMFSKDFIGFASTFFDHFLDINKEKVEKEVIKEISFLMQDFYHFLLSIRLNDLHFNEPSNTITYILRLKLHNNGSAGEMIGHNIKSSSPEELAFFTKQHLEHKTNQAA